MKNKTEVQAFLYKNYIEKISKLFLELKGTDAQISDIANGSI